MPRHPLPSHAVGAGAYGEQGVRQLLFGVPVVALARAPKVGGASRTLCWGLSVAIVRCEFRGLGQGPSCFLQTCSGGGAMNMLRVAAEACGVHGRQARR